MNDNIRERILRKLDTLPDERGYQVLDYVEFLESRYAERQNTASAFTRFTEAVEDKLRAGKVSASAIAETVGLMNRAANVLSGAVAATQKMATEFVSASNRPTGETPSSSPNANASSNSGGASSTGTSSTTSPQSAGASASSPIATTTPTEAPGASGEKL
jgi:hypothetical protein